MHSPTKSTKPIAVLISDIHYNINTLPLADASLQQAVNKANNLNVPLVIAGDLHDTKANIRGECVNAIRHTLKSVKTDCFIIVGNHDKINEKSVEHSLAFLEGLTEIVTTPKFCSFGAWLVPYSSNIERLRGDISGIATAKGYRYPLIMHQGLQGSNIGDYVIDATAITKEDVSGLRVISGHYHPRQTIKLPDGGQWDYIGNPYTLGWGEANDLEKGFQILMEDGSLEFVPTNLRKHIVVDRTAGSFLYDERPLKYLAGDLIWVKVRGDETDQNIVGKKFVTEHMEIKIPFKFDFIRDEQISAIKKLAENKTQPELLDELIDSLTNTSSGVRDRLKTLWKVL